MAKKNLLIFCAILMLPFASNAQRIWEGAYNRLGLKGGVNYFNIQTENLPVTGAVSWTAGFTTRSSFQNNFQFIYGLNFYDLNSTVTGREEMDYSTPSEEIDFKMIAVQANFFLSYKILGHFLSLEGGPVVQVNSKFEPAQNRELYYIDSYNIQAMDLEKVSPFNFNVAVGVSGGFEKFKFWAQYQYGLNNILNGLNDEGLGGIDSSATNFHGNISLISGGIIVFL